MIRCLALDFDGVLVDSNAAKRSAYFEVFASLGAPRHVIEEVLEKNRDGDRYVVIDRVLRRLLAEGSLGGRTDELIQPCTDHYNRICEEFAATCVEIYGASAALPGLAARYALFVNSATPEEPLRRIIMRRGWASYFREILGRPRTKSENLIRILAREGVEGAEVVVVGDRRGDLEAAVECGCQFVGMRSDENDFDGGDVVVVGDLSQLEAVLRERWG